MVKINENFTKLPGSYLFSNIAQKVRAYKEAHPGADVISLGIGDVTRPLAPKVIEEMQKAVREMADEKTFRGYPPELGYDFLREAVLEYDFKRRGVKLGADEIFISDGAKSDTGNIGDIFDSSNKVAVCDPVYPVYVDTNVMGGRAGELAGAKWSNIYYMTCTQENGFAPEAPKEKVDIIYLCFPNNPTGTTVGREKLSEYVDYARRNGSIILYDSAYERFITEDIPHSIYEIEGAKECAIEFRSFSKTAGFTGIRCGYTVVPKELVVGGVSLNKLWARRQSTKFNGVSYVTQRGAAAVYTEEGERQINETIAYYQNNARTISDALKSAGYKVWGGVNAPYIWLKTPNGMASWDFFDALLERVQVVGTPGVGFGPAGEGYFRLTAFGNADKTKEAVERIVKNF